MSYDNTNRGAIWPNEKMRPDKSDPHFTGSINIEGREYWLNAWKRKPDAKQGAPFLSFAVSPKEQSRAPNPNKPQYDEYDERRPPPPRDEYDF